MYLSPHALPALLASIACLVMVRVAWHRREAPGALGYALLMLALAHWAKGELEPAHEAQLEADRAAGLIP